MPDITNRLPFGLASSEGAGGGGSYSPQDYVFHYAIAGQPWLSATEDDLPYSERMAEIRKQQYDNFAEPGEQSIYGWWLRSQSSFGDGAGLLYQDPDNDNQFNYRFGDSLGVNTWVDGQVELLRTCSSIRVQSGTTNRVCGFVDPAGEDAAFIVDGNGLRKYTESSGLVSITTGSTGDILDMTCTGDRWIILATDGIWSGVDTGAGSQMYTDAATRGAIAFVKARIAVAIDEAVHFAPLNTGAAMALPTASYTHTDETFDWVSFTEGPNAIYAAGNDGTTGGIFRFTLESDGAAPTLTSGIVTAQLPRGELVRTIYGYVESFVGIATSKGFRVGEISGNGDIAYGPLLFEIEGGCQEITGFDRFLWTGSELQHDGTSGLYRIDLGATIQSQETRTVRYAYARDIFPPDPTTPRVVALDMFGSSDRKIFITESDDVWLESVDELVEEGYLETGRVRYNTEEPKLYRFLSIRTPAMLNGELQVIGLTEGGGEIPYITYGPNLAPGQNDVETPQPSDPQIWLAYRFVLRRNSTDSTIGAVLNGWQIKALPGSIRQRLITLSLECFDFEQDPRGQRLGHEGYAQERLQAFREMARRGDMVVFQELEINQSTMVLVEDWEYRQTAPPGPNQEGTGGKLSVVLRTVAESL